MDFVLDLHSHSKYSRAVSSHMVLPEIAPWARKKGIDVVSTSDWTHPVWFKELQNMLEEVSEGLYGLKGESRVNPYFLLSTEVAAIYSQGGKARRIHILIFAPNFTAAAKINQELVKRRMNLFSDGRPILGMSAKDVLKLCLEADERTIVIPAHIWTPWFSLFGSMSGFDSIEECFGELSQYIYGIETGLSSDPAMNWRIPELDNRAILSFSDAHSQAKLGRELTVISTPDEKISFEAIRQAIMQGSVNGSQYTVNSNLPTTDLPSTDLLNPDYRIAYTLEFYPEEGKYHYTGHRNCNVRQSPEETRRVGSICPACKRELTVGVMHRVDQLAGKDTQSLEPKIQIDENGVKWLGHPQGKRPPYAMLVPLLEILAEALDSVFGSKKVLLEYDKLTSAFGSEILVLLKTPISEIEKFSGPKTADAINRVRSGNIVVDPGYDGVFGKVKIWEEEAGLQKTEKVEKTESEQMGLF